MAALSTTGRPGHPDRRRGWLHLFWLATVYGIPAILIVLPLLTFLMFGFWSVEEGRILRDFSFDNYFAFAGNESYTRVFTGTLFLALRVMIINVLLGFAVAYFLSRLEGRLKYALVLGLIVPLLMSYIIKIYAIRGILGTSGLLNKLLIFLGILSQPSDLFLFNLTAVLITLSLALLPFTILPIFIALEKIPANYLEASADLGATPWQTFRRVTLPMALPGTVVGGMFCFVLAVGDFLAPELVGGTRGFTYGRLVFSQFGMAFNWPFGAALSVILLIVSLGVIVAAGRLGSPKWLRQ